VLSYHRFDPSLMPAPGRSSRAIVPGASEVQGRGLHGSSRTATHSTPLPGPLPGPGADRGDARRDGPLIYATLLLPYRNPSRAPAGRRSAGYGRLCGSLVRFYRDPSRYSALRLCPSFREGQPPGRGRCTRPGVRPGCSSGLRLPWGSASCPVVTSGRKDPGRVARADGRDPITSDHFSDRRRSKGGSASSGSPGTAPGRRVSIRSHSIRSDQVLAGRQEGRPGVLPVPIRSPPEVLAGRTGSGLRFVPGLLHIDRQKIGRLWPSVGLSPALLPAGGPGRCLGPERSRSEGYTESISPLATVPRKSSTTVPHTRPAAAHENRKCQV
jgi:hypothetical protein